MIRELRHYYIIKALFKRTVLLKRAEKAFSLLKFIDSSPRVYSRVVGHDNTKEVSKLLRRAAKQANEDQQKLVSKP